MKYMNNKCFSFVLLCVAAIWMTGCSNDKETYDNKAFFTSDKVNTILVMGTNDAQDATIKTAIAMPESQNVSVTYDVDASQVTAFNEMYGENAILVPSENYDFENKISIIEAGTLEGSDVTIHFKNLGDLDRDIVYVLPISVVNSTIDVLRSTKTAFFVIRAGALINTTADLTRNYLRLKNPSSSNLGGQTQLTMECLVKVSIFGKLISTLMGIEGNFLFRIGDAGVPDNQIQLATSNGNVTDAAWVVPTGEWVHIACTFDNSTGATEVYINGIKKGSTPKSNYRSSVNWNSDKFYIGKSWDDNRWLEGYMSEARVWNRVLTSEEINAKNHFYSVNPESEGLLAYWKFDEGTGSEIADHTGNGNTLVANSALTWKSVTLPE